MAACTRLPLLPLLNITNPVFRCVMKSHTKLAVQEPSYPLLVHSLTAKSKSAKRRQREQYQEKVREANVQDKLTLLSKIQRKKYVVYPQTFSLNADKWYQHFTKTVYLPGLPEQSSTVESQDGAAPSSSPLIKDSVFEDIRCYTSHAILQEHWHMKKRRPFMQKEQEHNVGPFLRNLVSGLTNTVAKHNHLLKVSSLDFNPQVNFYWLRGQRTIQKGHQRGRIEPLRFQIDDKPHSQIRIPHQLSQFIPLHSFIGTEVPEITFSPDVMPLFRRQYANSIFTGAKVPDPGCYGHTQFHVVPDRYRRDKMSKRKLTDQIEVFLRANGLASLFAWTGAQAMYQGFWSHEDVTRPFVSQAVVTDGQYFSFFCYQLNTLALCPETSTGNPRKNVLWGTESMRLYEGVEDGAVRGLDDLVLKRLVQFLMNH